MDQFANPLADFLGGSGFRIGEWLGATFWPLWLIAFVAIAIGAFLWLRRHGGPPRP